MPQAMVDVPWSLDERISTSNGNVVARATFDSCTGPLNASNWRWSLATEDGEALAELITATEGPLGEELVTLTGSLGPRIVWAME